MRGWLPRSSPPLLPSRSIRRLGRLVRYSRGQLVQQWESLQACPLQPRLDRCRAAATIAVRTHRDRHVRWCVHGAGEFLTGPQAGRAAGRGARRPADGIDQDAGPRGLGDPLGGRAGPASRARRLRCGPGVGDCTDGRTTTRRIDRCHVLAHGWVRQAGDHPGPGGRGGATRRSPHGHRRPAGRSSVPWRGWELSRCQAGGPARSWSPGSASRSWRTPWARFGRSSCGTILTDVDA